MSQELNLYKQLEAELTNLPNNTIEMNGGYLLHYAKNPGQFIFGILSLLSGVATGLLSVPSLMALRNLDHDASDMAIFAQHPGLLIMGSCSAIAQANFLLSDFIRVHGAVYKEDHKRLSLLQSVNKEFLFSLNLSNLQTDEFENENFIKVFDIELHKLAHKKIIALIEAKKNSLDKKIMDEEDWFEGLNFKKWRAELTSRIKQLSSFDDDLYEKLDERIKFLDQTYYQPIKIAMKDVLLANNLTEKNIDQTMVGIVKDSLNKYDASQDKTFRSEIVKLYEPLMHDKEGHFIEDQTIIKQSKVLGVFLSYLNIFVNVLIGLGAFFALGQFIFWVGGGSIAIFTATGILGWTIKILFASLCAIGSYLVTRLDIQEAFNNLGYRLTLWLKNKNKWYALWLELKKPRNIFTIMATLPAALGIAIINALGFYLAFQASPIIFALAVIVFVSTMIAIITMMGKRLYASYPRWCFYMKDLYNKRIPILFNLCVVGAAVSVFVVNAHYIPILFAFWSITPFSSFLLIACVAMVLFAGLMTLTNQWRWQVSLKGSIGTVCVIASIIAVFAALLPITGPIIAGFVAISSSILFFSFYVSSVMVQETSERKYIVNKTLSTQPSGLFSQSPKKPVNEQGNDNLEMDADDHHGQSSNLHNKPVVIVTKY